MNRDSQEQKIRQWFHEARRRDEARAPSFAESLAPAPSKTRRLGWRFAAWRIAFAMAALVVIGILTFVFFGPSRTRPPGPMAVGPNVAPPPDGLHAPAPVNPSSRDAAMARTVKGPRARSTPPPRRLRAVRTRSGAGGAALLSLKWQSPTDFLLRTPGADLLKSEPRLGDSLIRFEVILSDEKN
jgi:hypothetical protein